MGQAEGPNEAPAEDLLVELHPGWEGAAVEIAEHPHLQTLLLCGVLHT